MRNIARSKNNLPSLCKDSFDTLTSTLFLFHSVDAFKFARRIRANFYVLFFVSLLNPLTSVKIRCVIPASASQNPIILVVISVKYCTDC